MGLKHVLVHTAVSQSEGATRAFGNYHDGIGALGIPGPFANDPDMFEDGDSVNWLDREVPRLRNGASVGHHARPSNSESKENPINPRLDGLLKASAPYDGSVLQYETYCDGETCVPSGLPHSRPGSKFHTGPTAARLLDVIGNPRLLEEIQLQEHQMGRGEPRKLPEKAFKVLDAPDMRDDYYAHLLEWTGNRKMLAVALDNMVYLMSTAAWPSRSDIYWALDNNGETVNSIKFDKSGRKLAVGSMNGNLRIYDVTTRQLDQRARGHLGKVCGLSWKGEDPYVLSSASTDIVTEDLRAPTPVGVVKYQFKPHNEATAAPSWVCGLQWSPDGQHLASSGNNVVKVFDAANLGNALLYNDDSSACVRSAWDPHHRGILACGSGKDDRKLRIFNTQSPSILGRMTPRAELDVGSQVCDLEFNPVELDELVVTNGWGPLRESNSAVSLWSTKKRQECMRNLVDLPVNQRPCQLALSADGRDIAVGTGEGDQGGRLSFLRVVGEATKSNDKRQKENRNHQMVGGIGGFMRGIRDRP